MRLPSFPIFFPDATRAVIKTLDTTDIKNTKTQGILVNTYHLYKDFGPDVIRKSGGVKKMMGWSESVISDSGGFQVGSLIKKNPKFGKVTNIGVTFKGQGEKSLLLTPQKSIRFQMDLGVDMVVALDDFTDPKADYKKALESVERTILWAKKTKDEFEKICKERKLSKNKRPYILGVVQGGKYLDLRKYCIEKLVKIGFDGLGYGGWPIKENGEFDYDVAKVMVKYSPKNYMLYGLGVGKPHEIVNLVKMGFDIFDCVLPTRDARHGRLYVYNAKSIGEINVLKPDFYSYLDPTKTKNLDDFSPISTACDCLTCKKYTRSYLAHLFKIKDFTAGRLATIHNLRFYSILMEKLKLTS